eukprot:Polyplicarium_translucidae@DN3380_c3_g2_i2.p1
MKAIVTAALAIWSTAAVDPTDYVKTNIGWDNRFELSGGNTLPIVGAPWGHTYWVPEVTHADDMAWWWFNPRSPKLVGVRCTHQPSPWIGDWGFFRVLFGYAAQTTATVTPKHANGYDPREATWEPWLWQTDLVGLDMRTGRGNVSVTAGHADAMFLIKFPANDQSNGMSQTRRIAFERSAQREFNSNDWDVVCADGKTIVKGKTDNYADGVTDHTRFFMRLHMEIDAECESEEIFAVGTVGDIQAVDFGTDQDHFNVRIGVSLIDHDQALQNRKHLDGKTFDDVRDANRWVWKDTLEVIDVSDTGYPEDEQEKELTIFYSMLYRSCLFPRNLAELLADGETWVHRSPNIKKCEDAECNDVNYDMRPGPLSSDSGFWDAYHTIYDFLQLFYPHRLEIVLKGYLNAYKEGEWVPQWSSPGYRESMDGTMSDVSFADSMLKGFIEGDDDEDSKKTWHRLALEAMHQHSMTEPPCEPRPLPEGKSAVGYDYMQDMPWKTPRKEACNGRQIGRRGIKAFREHDYIPWGTEDNFGKVMGTTSQTLLHGFADFAINAAAVKFDTEDPPVFNTTARDDLVKAAGAWKNQFDATEKFMRPKLEDGDWADKDKFDEFLWGDWYTEGGPHQYRFTAPHDVSGMIGNDGFGSIKNLCDEVIGTHTAPRMYHRMATGATGGYIGGESGNYMMRTWGQTIHANQPSHHFQFMPIAAMEFSSDLRTDYDDCVKPTQEWLRYTMKNCYSLTNYCGDEDNGEMSAWYVLNALGFYDMAPSTLKYHFGIPHFKEVLVNSDTLKEFMVTTTDFSPAEKAVVEKVEMVDPAKATTVFDKWFMTWEQLKTAGAAEGSSLHFDFAT